ncbi:MAG: RIP metalloprotease RseP, partial [Aquificota bacterium]
MEYVLAFLVLIGVLIWFHELGHFLMARLFGVRVDIFSIGFGPVLFSKRVGDTEYRVSVLPLGGFVKLYGEEEQIQDPRAFSSKPNWQKILIAFGGPLFNFILAIILFALISVVGREVPKYLSEKPLVGHVVENSIAHKLGIREGDIIIEVNSKPVDKWRDVEKVVFENILSKSWTVKVLRDGRELSLHVKDSISRSAGFGAEPWLPAVIGRVVEDSPASQVGLQAGDRILRVNGREVRGWYELVRLIRESGDRPITLAIQRGEYMEEKTVIPKVDQRTGLPVLGIAPHVEREESREPPLQAFIDGVQRTYMLSLLSLKALWSLITGGLSIKT